MENIKNIQSAKIKNGKASLFAGRFISYFFLVLLVLLCILPFYILIINCTRSNAEIQKGFSFVFGNQFITNWKSLRSDDQLPIIKAIRNSLFISGATAIITTYFSSMTAHAINTYRFKFRKAAYIFILIIMMIPPQVSSSGFIRYVFKFNLENTYYPLILPAIASPVVFFFIKQYMESVLPHDLIEAARIDGASEFRTFHQMVLPIIMPAIAVQLIFAFVSSWNNFYMPSLIIETATKRTIPLLINELRSGSPETFDLGKVYMLMTFAIVPILAVYLVLSRFIIRGVTLGSVKG